MARATKNEDGSAPTRGVSKKAKKDPNRIKRSRSAYMIWLSEVRSTLTKPGMSVVEVAKEAGKLWNTLTDKTRWEKLAELDKERYNKEIAASKAQQP
uniref:HMG box domain-containing protein n=1 Tax=Rhabditophanes sp. KR3021 TaxID=114890 RepID=A0AC35TNL0_9BILA